MLVVLTKRLIINNILRKKLSNIRLFSKALKEVGQVLSIKDGIARCSGLINASLQKMVLLGILKTKGRILKIEKTQVYVEVLGNSESIQVGDSVYFESFLKDLKRNSFKPYSKELSVIHTFRMEYNKRHFFLSMAKNFFFKSNDLFKFLNKDSVWTWLECKLNQKIFKEIQRIVGSCILYTTKGRGTWICLELVLSILNSFNLNLVGLELLNKFNLLFLKDSKISKAQNWVLKDSYVYAYRCNNLTKYGNSIVNFDGSCSRMNSFGTSVPNIKVEFIIYIMGKSSTLEFQDEVENILGCEFIKQKYHWNHFLAEPLEIKNFIVNTCNSVGWCYWEVPDNYLKFYNDSF